MLRFVHWTCDSEAGLSTPHRGRMGICRRGRISAYRFPWANDHHNQAIIKAMPLSVTISAHAGLSPDLAWLVFSRYLSCGQFPRNGFVCTIWRAMPGMV